MKIGQQYTRVGFFNSTNVNVFTLIVEDRNPVHYDKKYCEQTIFKKPIVPGMLVASLFSGLLSSKYPGAIYLGQTLKFLKPVYLNEQVTAEIEVINIREDKPILTFKTTCYKKSGEIAIIGEAVIKI